MMLAQLEAPAGALPIPDIAWSTFAPELVLFGTGILVLLLDTAGRQRVQAAFLVFGVLVAGALFAAVQTGEILLPGLVGLAAVLQFALVALWRDRPRTLGAILTALGFIGGLGTTVWLWLLYAGQLVPVQGAGQGAGVAAPQALVGTATSLANMVAVDGVALFTRFIVTLVGLLTVLLGFSYAEDRRIHRGEYYPLLLFAATGMTLLGSSADLIMVFVAIEVLSLALYILAGFAKRDLLSQEAGLKYFLLGAFSSALLLYGIALTYGVAGTTNIAAAGRALALLGNPSGLVFAALGLLLVGFGFKTALVPFHMWTPDVYQGAPTPVTGFQAAGTKTAAFAAFLRVFVGALAPLQWSWVPVVWVIAVLTMLVGAVLAVVQTDLKRMLAYSAVAHSGYLMIGLVSVSREGVSATLLYLFIYALMTLGAFGILAALERRRRKAMAIPDLRGLGRRYPVPAGMFALFLLSLAGIPGTAGFMAKFAVFRAGIEAGHVALVVIGVVSSAIAAFFYIRVIVAMFMEDESEADVALPPLEPSLGASVGIAFAAVAVLVLGVVPADLVDLAQQAATFAR